MGLVAQSVLFEKSRRDPMYDNSLIALELCFLTVYIFLCEVEFEGLIWVKEYIQPMRSQRVIFSRVFQKKIEQTI